MHQFLGIVITVGGKGIQSIAEEIANFRIGNLNYQRNYAGRISLLIGKLATNV
jgi:hypothetical protein